MTVNAAHVAILPSDRGGRQRLKAMQLLAAVDGDGRAPLAETLVATMPRLRRGMAVVVVTPSLDREWVRPLGMLRGRGVATVVVALDAVSFAEATEGLYTAALVELGLILFVITLVVLSLSKWLLHSLEKNSGTKA